MAAAVPPSVKPWFKSQYPHLELDEQWLSECYDHLKNMHPSLKHPALLKKVENQLLLSDLAASTVPHAQLLPPNDGQEAELVIQTTRHGILVQVLEILEIGRSALELLKLHRERREDKRVLSEHGRAVIRANLNVDPTQEEGQDEQDGQPVNGKSFPWAMLRLRVSDGFTEYVAIESKPVTGLSLDDTPLGCKLFLKNIRCLRGTLLLSNATCTVKGGAINELDARRDELLEELLQARIEGRDGVANENRAPPPLFAPRSSPAPEPARNARAQPRQSAQVARQGPIRQGAPRQAPPRAPPVQHRLTSVPHVPLSSSTALAPSTAARQRRSTTASSNTLVGNVKAEIKDEDHDEDGLDEDLDLNEDELYMLMQEDHKPETSKQGAQRSRPGQQRQHVKDEEEEDELEDQDDDDEFDAHALEALQQAEEEHTAQMSSRQRSVTSTAAASILKAKTAGSDQSAQISRPRAGAATIIDLASSSDAEDDAKRMLLSDDSPKVKPRSKAARPLRRSKQGAALAEAIEID